ncbi:hypothetical protein FN846DRAFT_361248 [Sphaerosporella brunnea]|uniref:Uncharacterized protein n=1 Tax=Sphaerosporella brunnea TaxID=1250544 RepID=A0A5J5F675_9PEZI|nr:hypothetical protein FN846DRAFT_361248 [Sphaerosporella brunnea]
MSSVTVTSADLSALAGKNCIITGGSTGIGEATVKLLFDHGATVTIGDINDAVGEALAASFPERVSYVHCDVSSWESVLSLFSAAAKQGPIDIVFSNAGVTGKEQLLEDTFTSSGELAAPTFPDVAVNLTGTLHMTKLALHHFRKTGTGRLVLTGSAASYLDTPPLWNYSAAKHGVLGLMRALRCQVREWGDVTVNMIAPWFTLTPMAATLGPKWGDRPANSPAGVAKALAFAATGKEWRDGGVGGKTKLGDPVNGCTFWVGGDEIVEFERATREARTLWMGETLTLAVNEGQEALGGW